MLACNPEASRQQVEAAAAAAALGVGVGGGEGGRTKSCMSSRVVVVSIKPIIIANAYASLSAKELRVFAAKPGEDWQCLQGGEWDGVSWVPLLLFSSGMRQMQQTCSPGPARSDMAGQTKPQAALLKGRTGCRRRGVRLERHPDHLEAVTAHCQLSAGHNCGRG